MTREVKHGGCAICKSKDQEILVSIMAPGEVMSIAICDKCRANVEDKSK